MRKLMEDINIRLGYKESVTLSRDEWDQILDQLDYQKPYCLMKSDKTPDDSGYQP